MTKPLEGEGPNRGRQSPWLLPILMIFPVAIAMTAALVFNRPFLHQSLFALSNHVGPTTQSLLRGDGLTVCTTEMGTPGNPICFHAGRMPLPSLVVAAGIRPFGDSFLHVALFKTLLFLLPVEFSIWLVWRSLPQSRPRQAAIMLLLLAPFAMTPFLADVVNLQVEEAYAYSLLSAAVAILFFGRCSESRVPSESPHYGCVIVFGLTIDALYLSKSSMLPAVFTLAAVLFLQQRSKGARFLLLLLAVATPVGWAIHQHHASGRYSLGTSLDGINLHKANVSGFLGHYPPPAGSSLDQYDADLNRGHSFPDEWKYSDFHQRAAIAYIRSHPEETVRGDVRKLDVLLFSVTKYGSSESHGIQLVIEIAGLVLFRLMFWVSVGYAAFSLKPLLLSRHRPASSSPLRRSAAAYLALVAACVVPYFAGFAYTRHASILIYPASLMCCRVLCTDKPEGSSPR